MDNIHFVHVGVSGFPFGSAAINKCLAVYEVLVKNGNDVLIINSRAKHSKDVPLRLKKKDYYQNVCYVYTTPSPYKPNNFFLRRYYNLVGRTNEFILIVSLIIRKRIDVLIYYPHGLFFELIYYRILSKIFCFPIISHYVEFRTAFTSRQKIWLRINDILFDKYFMRFVDGIMPISEFLIKHLKKRGFKDKFIKVPPIVDYSNFSKTVTSSEKYFLYVGSIDYYEAIELILGAFNSIKSYEFLLYLVINGTPYQLDKLKSEIEKLKNANKIKIFSKLEYSKLINLYIGAQALLLPLSNSIQDRARFPQKISEYLASKKPIITTKNGEINYYFKDKINALIGEHFTIESIANKMNFVINNEALAKEIGLKGFETGLKYFDSNAYKEKLKNFIGDILNSHT